MQCKNCGKENLEGAKYCTSCGTLLLEEERICSVCGTKNANGAKFCKNCGTSFEEKNICPSCGLENKKEAKYCKSCGTPLKKQEKKPIFRFIFQIISLCICSFVILYSFGATFADFMCADMDNMSLQGVFDETNINLFQVIKNISTVNEKQIVVNCGTYAKVSELIPNIVSLLGICTAMIGCFVMLVQAVIKTIQSVQQRKLPNLERISMWSTGFLLAGLLVVSLEHFDMNFVSAEASIGIGYKYGGVVLSAICIGIIWKFISYLVEFILRIIEGCCANEIRNRIFKMVEMTLIVILIFNIVIGFAKIYIDHDEGNLTFQLSSLVYFRYAYLVSGVNSMYELKMSSEMIQSLVMSTILVVFMILFATLGIIFFISRLSKEKEETSKSSLCCGIVFMASSIVLLIISCVAAPMILKNSSQFLDLLFGGSGEVLEILKSTISNNVIVFVVFSCILLIIEVVWKVLDSKNTQMNEVVQ